MAYKCSDHHYWNTDDMLGQGATCVVFKGISETGEVRALKVFTENCSRDQKREEDALKALKHENIVTFYGIETERISRGRVLVTEYCDGGSLYNFLCEPENAYGLQDSDFLTILHHLTLGLRHLREHGFVHRDIKPGNILRCLDDRGKSVFKLSDFGTARPLTDSQNFQSLVGTEEYLHPEIYKAAFFDRRGANQFHSATDLWSLGCTLYHAATGKVPFRPHHGRSDKQTMFNMISKKPPGAISGLQTSAGGEVKWSSQLPDTCPLSKGLQFFLLPLLAGLLETRTDQFWTYEKYFDAALGIVNKKHIVVLCAVTDNEFFRSVYVEAHESLNHVRKQLSRQCGISVAGQTLLLQDDVMHDADWPSMHQFPATSPHAPLVLLSRQQGAQDHVNPVHIEICSESSRARFNSGFHLGHEFKTAVDSDFHVAKKVTEQVALMYSQVKVMAQYQQEVMRVRQMLRSKLRVRREALERRMVAAQSLLRQLEPALQGAADTCTQQSSQIAQLNDQISKALWVTKEDVSMEPQSLNLQERTLSDIEWCYEHDCTLRAKRLLQQAKELMVEFGRRRSIIRAPNKPTQLMMHRDRAMMERLLKKAVKLWQEHCCSVTSTLTDNLHTWYSAQVHADQKLERREADTERLSQDIAASLPAVLQAGALSAASKRAVSQQLLQELIDIPKHPVPQYSSMAETLNSLENLTKDLPEVYVVNEMQEQEEPLTMQEEQEEEPIEPTRDQQRDEPVEPIVNKHREGPLEQVLGQQGQEKEEERQDPEGFVSRLAEREEESLPYMDCASLGWTEITQEDLATPMASGNPAPRKGTGANSSH